jgi:hypothetical protein
LQGQGWNHTVEEEEEEKREKEEEDEEEEKEEKEEEEEEEEKKNYFGQENAHKEPNFFYLCSHIMTLLYNKFQT